MRWLLIIVIAELLVIIGLTVWLVVRQGNTPSVPQEVTTQTEDGILTTSLVATGLGVPTDIAATPIAGDDRLFVPDRAGVIRIVNRGKVEDPAVFMDIAAKVLADGEMGLLGMVFHPSFAQNGYFYINYVDKEQFTNIARFQVNAQGLADPATEKTLLKLKQPYGNHNAGGLAFGPDGFLYIPLGDGGSGGDPQNRAQNKMKLLGKLLRVDVDSGDPYAVPANNPFVADAGFKPEIWAWGLRNPWRISFDTKTGDLYIADVGQGEVEELNFQPAGSAGGENYGWRCFEGTQPFNSDGCQEASTYVLPVAEYTHAEAGRCSITGGYVYRGQRLPNLEGTYIYGDFCSGEIFSATKAGDTWTQALLLKTPYTISTFGQDQNGEIYVADMASGSIYHITTD